MGLPILAGGYYGFLWLADNMIFVRFRPVCNDFDRYQFDLDKLHIVWGDPTEEFWDLLHRRFQSSLGKDWIYAADGKIFVQLSYYFPLPHLYTRHSGEVGEYAYFATRDVAYRIFRRRLGEARFDDADMSAYMATRGPNRTSIDVPKLMRPYECGFVEDLILEGGRFAR